MIKLKNMAASHDLSQSFVIEDSVRYAENHPQ